MTENEVDKKFDEGILMNKNTPRQHDCIALVLKCKDFLAGVATIQTLPLVLIGLVVFGFAVETQLMTYLPQISGLIQIGMCSPRVLNVSEIQYHSGHRFYATLKERGPPTPLTFRSVHTKLCEENLREEMKFQYCLPIGGRKDIPYCTTSDRTDLLSVPSPKSVCFASVLHMLLVDVYDELKAAGNTPLIVYGSLLGAVRNGSMIPFTEDADIGYDNKTQLQGVQRKLWEKGYHMFYYGLWRVCVAPTHPLAFRLYDQTVSLNRSFDVPYVDLYRLEKLETGSWMIEEFDDTNSELPNNKIEPFSKVTINGIPFDTVHDPHYFLAEAYGPDYLTPLPRTHLRPGGGRPKMWEKILEILQHES